MILFLVLILICHWGIDVWEDKQHDRLQDKLASRPNLSPNPSPSPNTNPNPSPNPNPNQVQLKRLPANATATTAATSSPEVIFAPPEAEATSG